MINFFLCSYYWSSLLKTVKDRNLNHTCSRERQYGEHNYLVWNENKRFYRNCTARLFLHSLFIADPYCSSSQPFSSRSFGCHYSFLFWNCCPFSYDPRSCLHENAGHNPMISPVSTSVFSTPINIINLDIKTRNMYTWSSIYLCPIHDLAFLNAFSHTLDHSNV